MIRQIGLLTCVVASTTCLVSGALPRGYDRLILARTANATVESAAVDLSERLAISHGEQPAISRHRLFEAGKGIHIGAIPDHPLFDTNPLTDEILILRNKDGLVIAGSDNTATAFAVYRFLDVFLGWRYYQPGPLGLERMDNAGEAPPLSGEEGILLHEKAGFYGRNLSRLKTPAGWPDWSNWQGLRERFEYNHSLHKVVTPSLFESHSDWFAKDTEGKPMRPPYDVPHGYNDHPDLTHPGVLDYVEKWAQKKLEKERALPGKQVVSISLSLGDSFIFGTFPKPYPWTPDGYFRRWPDWGNHVFNYTNELAQRTVDHWDSLPWQGEKPKLYLGALSYLNWEKPPQFQVHPAILPYLTFDRSQWYDPVAVQDDLANIEAWRPKGPEFLGTWDYLFGYGFLMPRSMTRIVSDSIPAIHRRGVRAYFSQVAPIWPFDLHTTWLTARLLWNPAADANALMEEFYREFYGPAEKPMRAFFARAESTWMNQSGSGWWLRYWKDPWQAALWAGSDLDDMDSLLKEALRAAETADDDRFLERVRQTSELFAVTRLFILYENLSWEVHSGKLESAALALRSRKELQQAISETVRTHPQASFAKDLSWIHRYDSLGGALADAYRQGNTSIAPLLREWCSLEGLKGLPSGKAGVPVLYDTQFSAVDNPRVWKKQHLDSDALAMGVTEEGSGFFAESVRRGHIYQLFKAVPGHFYLGFLDVETRQSPSGEVYIRLDFFNQANELIGESRRVRIAPVDAFGTRQILKALMQAPETASHGRLFIRFYEMDMGSRADLFTANVLDLGLGQNP